MTSMEIDTVDYGVKPCPICGQMEFLRITPRQSYEELYDSFGAACIEIECRKCFLELYEHNIKEKNYHAKVTALVNKWNAMPRATVG